MKDFFLNVWVKNMGVHYTQECIIHAKHGNCCEIFPRDWEGHRKTVRHNSCLKKFTVYLVV